MVLVRLSLLAILAATAGYLAGRYVGRFLSPIWQATFAGIGFLMLPLVAYALATVSDKGEEMASILDFFFALVLGVPAGMGWALGVATALRRRA